MASTVGHRGRLHGRIGPRLCACDMTRSARVKRRAFEIAATLVRSICRSKMHPVPTSGPPEKPTTKWLTTAGGNSLETNDHFGSMRMFSPTIVKVRLVRVRSPYSCCPPRGPWRNQRQKLLKSAGGYTLEKPATKVSETIPSSNDKNGCL